MTYGLWPFIMMINAWFAAFFKALYKNVFSFSTSLTDLHTVTLTWAAEHCNGRQMCVQGCSVVLRLS